MLAYSQGGSGPQCFQQRSHNVYLSAATAPITSVMSVVTKMYKATNLFYLFIYCG